MFPHVTKNFILFKFKQLLVKKSINQLFLFVHLYFLYLLIENKKITNLKYFPLTVNCSSSLFLQFHFLHISCGLSVIEIYLKQLHLFLLCYLSFFPKIITEITKCYITKWTLQKETWAKLQSTSNKVVSSDILKDFVRELQYFI